MIKYIFQPDPDLSSYSLTRLGLLVSIMLYDCVYWILSGFVWRGNNILKDSQIDFTP